MTALVGRNCRPDIAAVSLWRSFDMGTRVVLITGALTGIGRATALAFASEGSNLVVSGRRDDAGLALARELHSLGRRGRIRERRCAPRGRSALSRRTNDRTIWPAGRR